MSIRLVFNHDSSEVFDTNTWCGESNEAPAIKNDKCLYKVKQCLLIL